MNAKNREKPVCIVFLIEESICDKIKAGELVG
jgi:hypothetical protein